MNIYTHNFIGLMKKNMFKYYKNKILRTQTTRQRMDTVALSMSFLVFLDIRNTNSWARTPIQRTQKSPLKLLVIR